MNKIIRYIIVVFLLQLSHSTIAKEVITIGVGNFPPFFIEKDNKGLFVELINQIFSELPQYDVKFLYMSNHRLLHEINSGKLIDVAANIFAESDVDAHLSVPIFRYTDVAVSRANKKLAINVISDLQGKSIAAYQGAKELLGSDFKQMAESNAQYSEHSHPKDTTYLMVTGSKDIRVGDINIFWYDLQNKFYDQKNNIEANQFTIHRLWPDVYSHLAFKNEDLRNDVDQVIKKLKNNGAIDNIYNKYLFQNGNLASTEPR